MGVYCGAVGSVEHEYNHQTQKGVQGLAVSIHGLHFMSLEAYLLLEDLNELLLFGLQPYTVLLLGTVPCLLLGGLPGDVLCLPDLLLYLLCLLPHLPLLCQCQQPL